MLAPVEIKVISDAAALSQAAASWIVGAILHDSGQASPFSLVLSGGSTPRGVYNLLAGETLTQAGGWQHVHIFWGDERCVPPDHPDSNFRMANETLLSKIAIPAENIHPIQAELGCRLAAYSYEYQLRHFFTGGRVPDLILLGLGDDGHIASLFPGSAALLERTRWAMEVQHLNPPPPLVDRVTVGIDLINRAARVAFLVSGASKAAIVRQAVRKEERFYTLPVHLVDPPKGKITWFLDQAAAASLQD